MNNPIEDKTLDLSIGIEDNSDIDEHVILDKRKLEEISCFGCGASSLILVGRRGKNEVILKCMNSNCGRLNSIILENDILKQDRKGKRKTPIGIG